MGIVKIPVPVFADCLLDKQGMEVQVTNEGVGTERKLETCPTLPMENMTEDYFLKAKGMAGITWGRLWASM